MTTGNMSTRDASESHPQLSLIVPVYNESENIHLLYEELMETLPGLDMKWEIIFADDGSTDNTWEIIESLHAGLGTDGMQCNMLREAKEGSLIRAAKHAYDLGATEHYILDLIESISDYWVVAAEDKHLKGIRAQISRWEYD